MRTESLEIFVAAAQTRSVSRAAKQRFVTQQGASKAIRALEQELGCELFLRTATGLELTRAGERIFAEAQTMLAAHHRMQLAAAAKLNEPVEGSLLIMTTPFITNQLTVLFSQFEEHNPEIRVRIIERSPFKIIKDFTDPDALDNAHVAGESNAIRLVGLPTFASRLRAMVADDFTPLVASELVALGHREGPLAAFETITARQLCSLPLIWYNEEFLNRLVHHQFAGLQPTIELRTSNQAMFFRALQDSRHVTFTDSLSAFLSDQVPGFVQVPVVDATGFVVGFLGNTHASETVHRFVRFSQRFFSTVCAAYMRQYEHISFADEPREEDA